MNRFIDWDPIRRAYIEGDEASGSRYYPSMADLAKRYGITERSVQRKAAKEKWIDQRREFVARVEQIARKQRAAAVGATTADLDTNCLTIARAGLIKCAQAMQEAREPVALQRLASAVEGYQRIYRLIDGESTENINLSGGGIAGMVAKYKRDGVAA